MSGNEISYAIIGFLIITGSLFSLISAIGLIRLPDIYTRSHAATKSSTLGIICVLTGSFIFFVIDQSYVSARLILGIIFVFLTAPVAGHLICRAAYRTNVPLWDKSVQDDLRHILKRDDYNHKSTEFE
ncbi:Na+/H+ antiporter subunit G [Caldalkalibacillus salinus]|uniref:Na+/H+ antiporter subunit G n=1 Tax=Caldalkalibacillus salinus TaxID=2803787 RepID=UPI001F287F81|nr:Na+/H+ antiporter subunit G [Caldalkalibacillus salinus]